jgi:MFS family permease
LAQAGAFLSFVPLLQILVPLKVEAIDPAHKAALLARVLLLGALTAGAANLVAGALSDRTRSPLGRRRPWMLAGLVGMILAYLVIAQARTADALVVGVVLFQLTFNCLFAALLPILADRVPDGQKGWVSALLGAGFPLGAAVGSIVVGQWISEEGWRYAALALLVSAAVLPFALTVQDVRSDPPPEPFRPLAWLRSFWVDPRKYPDFAMVWSGRFLVVTAHSLAQGFLLFYLQDAVKFSQLFPGVRAESGLAMMTAVWSLASVCTGLLCGRLSDRLRRRKGFAILGALLLAAGMAGFAASFAWPLVLASSLLLGFGVGCYYTVDLALVTQVLPRRQDTGKDLGLVNLSNALPQVLAPALAGWLLGTLHADIRSLFVIAAVGCCAGALLIVRIRSVQ